MDLLSTAQVKDPAGNAVNISMAYSRTGNITSNSRLGAYTYSSSRPNAVRAAGSNTYDYDANGNMKTRITGARNQSMVFDYENRLASITEGANRNDYLYDYTGARVKKVSLVSGVTSTTVYIGGIYEQKDGVNLKHIFAGGRRVASRKGSSTFYFHPDHLGSLSVVTNAAGESKQTATYYPFGETRDSTGPEDFDYKFTGQENDPESGLYYYGARYYDPEIGRFISPDSIVPYPGDPQSLNRYAYCRNNPLLYTDPTGHIFGIDDLIIGIIIGAVLGATTSAISGGDIGLGALTGAITGGFLAGAGGIVEAFKLTGVVAAGAYAAAGASAGAINAGISGSNVGIGALSGGAFAAAAYALPTPNFKPFGQSPVGTTGNRLFNSSLTGAAFGAVSAGMTGGDMLYGAGMGAAAWAGGEAAGMLVGHGLGMAMSKNHCYEFQNGAFLYDIGGDGWITFSNVIIGDSANISRSMQSYIDRGAASPPSYFDHEIGHSAQQTILGPAYIPAHALSLGVGAGIGLFYGLSVDVGSHQFGLLEHYWHPVPEPPR